MDDASASVVRCRNLHQFVREAWPVLEPGTELKDNWHIDAICLHLEAITFDRLNHPPRLAINIAGGFMKSLIVSVFWQAWEWSLFPHLRYFTTSYNQAYAKRDARKTRDLILSPWYQDRWPHVQLTRDGEMSFANSQRGEREAMPFASLTGGRGNRVIIDDPHSVDSAESELERYSVTRRFRESVQDRLNDPQKDAIVIVMHRLHMQDICGVIDDLQMPYEKLIIPMEYEPDRLIAPTILGWVDPRTYAGELLHPAHMPRPNVDQLKRDFGAVATASKLQQQPISREGNYFKRDWFEGKVVSLDSLPKHGWVACRHWDLAASAKSTGARTAGILMRRYPDGRFVIMSCVATQQEGDAVRRLIKQQAEIDGKRVHISLPQDPGQAGKVQAQDYIKQLAGWVVMALPETGDKPSRAEPFAAQCEAGNVYFVDGDWNEALFDELCQFPSGKWKDRVDACSGAFGYLTTQKMSTYTLANIL